MRLIRALIGDIGKDEVCDLRLLVLVLVFWILQRGLFAGGGRLGACISFRAANLAWQGWPMIRRIAQSFGLIFTHQAIQ